MMARGTLTLLRTVSIKWKNASFVLPSMCRSFHVGGPLSADILQGRWASSHQYQQLDLEGKCESMATCSWNDGRNFFKLATYLVCI